MAYYNTCPECGALLDPCEVCDCKKDAAPGAATTENGKNVNTDINSILHAGEKDKGEFLERLHEGLSLDEQIQLLDWGAENGIDLPIVRAYKMLRSLSDEQIEKLMEEFQRTEVNA